MANVKIISVVEKDVDAILKENIENSIQLFFIPMVSVNNDDAYDIGDVVKSTKFDDRYAIIVKDDIGMKMSENAILLGVYNLLERLQNDNKPAKSLAIIVGESQFKTNREMYSFETAVKFVLKTNKDFKNISDFYIIYTTTEQEMIKDLKEMKKNGLLNKFSSEKIKVEEF